MADIRFKRGTAAQIADAAAANQLAAGEPYLVTDKGTVAIGRGAGSAQTLVAGDGLSRITVSTTPPVSPSVGDIWINPSV